MKKIITALLLITIVLLACRSSSHSGKLLQKPADIKADEYTINTLADTNLLTRNGAILFIPAGSLKSSQPSVTLEIKEAYTMEQMIRSGLTTKAGEELLSSGGMIEVTPKSGEEVTIIKPIKIAIPGRQLNENMKLFKGGKAEDGSINWGNPAPLPENPQLNMIRKGQGLFQQSCASCHSNGKRLTGPDLAHFLKRFSGDTLLVRGYSLHLPFINRDSDAWFDLNSITDKGLRDKLSHIDPSLWQNQWLYFCNQKSQYGSLGLAYPGLSEADLTSIYQYIQNESERLNLPIPVNAIPNDCIDSCYQYKNQKKILIQKREAAEVKMDTLKKDKHSLSKEKRIIPITPDTTPVNSSVPPPVNNSPIRIEDIVEPENKKSLYYQFNIESFGWYNVDVLLKEVDGSVKSDLSVRLTGEHSNDAEVFLIIPSTQTYTKAGKKKDQPDQLVFAYNDGSIYLPQQTTAYILAIAETKNSVAFVIKPFTTGLKQEFEISLQTADPETFNEAIRRLNLNGISIKAAETPNAPLLRDTEKEIQNLDSALKNLEQLRPRNCDCDCLQIWDSFVQASPVADNSVK
jgi:hypothetical protein